MRDVKAIPDVFAVLTLTEELKEMGVIVTRLITRWWDYIREITPLPSNVKRIGAIITLKTYNLFHRQYLNGATDNIAIQKNEN